MNNRLPAYDLVRIQPSHRTTLLPYTTLFRSVLRDGWHARHLAQGLEGRDHARARALRPGQFSQRPLAAVRRGQGPLRSEEHTSELQSPCNLVCRLLLEKKKTREQYVHCITTK